MRLRTKTERFSPGSDPLACLSPLLVLELPRGVLSSPWSRSEEKEEYLLHGIVEYRQHHCGALSCGWHFATASAIAGLVTLFQWGWTQNTNIKIKNFSTFCAAISALCSFIMKMNFHQNILKRYSCNVKKCYFHSIPFLYLYVVVFKIKIRELLLQVWSAKRFWCF